MPKLTQTGLTPLGIILILVVLIGIGSIAGYTFFREPFVAQTTSTPTSSPTPTAAISRNSVTPSPKPTAKPSPSPIPTPTATSLPQNTFNIEMTCLDIDPANGYPTDRAKIYANGKVVNSSTGGIWATLTDEKNVSTILFFGADYGQVPYNFDFTISKDVRDIRTDKGTVSLIGEPDRKYTFKIYSAPYTEGAPNLDHLLYQQSLNKDCRYNK